MLIVHLEIGYIATGTKNHIDIHPLVQAMVLAYGDNTAC